MSGAEEPEALYRAPTEWEMDVLRRLLEPDFPGRDALRAQARSIKVRTIDGNGSLLLRPAAGPRAAVERRVPTEGEAADSDGMTIHFLLHVHGGMLRELEAYKDDSSAVATMPEAEQLRVFSLPP